MKKIVLLLALNLNSGLMIEGHKSRVMNATPGKIQVKSIGVADEGGIPPKSVIKLDFKPNSIKDIQAFIDEIIVDGLSNAVKNMHIKKSYNVKRGYFVIYLEDPIYLTIDEAKAAGIPIPTDTKELPIIKPGSGKLAVKTLSADIF